MNDLAAVIAAIKSGDKPRARELLRTIIQQSPSADAYYLAASVALNRAQAIQLLQTALRYDPSHARSIQALHRLNTAHAPPPAAQSDPAPRPDVAADGEPAPMLRVRQTSPQTAGSPTNRQTPPAPAKINDQLAGKKGAPRLPAIPEALRSWGYEPRTSIDPMTVIVTLIASILLGVLAGVLLYVAGKFVITPVIQAILDLMESVFEASLSGSIRVGGRTIIFYLLALIFLGLIGLGYPILVGIALAFGIWQIIKFGRTRSVGWTMAIGLLTTIISYGLFVFLVTRNDGLAHTTSGVLITAFRFQATPWWAYLAMGIEALLFVLISSGWVLDKMETTPFSEKANKWYDPTWQVAYLAPSSADTLFHALETGSTAEIGDVQTTGNKAFPRLEVKLRTCSDDPTADYQLAIRVHWEIRTQVVRSGKAREDVSKEIEDWFWIMIPAELGRALTRRLAR